MRAILSKRLVVSTPFFSFLFHLPTARRSHFFNKRLVKFSVNKAHHVHKKAKEHFIFFLPKHFFFTMPAFLGTFSKDIHAGFIYRLVSILFPSSHSFMRFFFK